MSEARCSQVGFSKPTAGWKACPGQKDGSSRWITLLAYRIKKRLGRD